MDASQRSQTSGRPAATKTPKKTPDIQIDDLLTTEAKPKAVTKAKAPKKLKKKPNVNELKVDIFNPEN